jgi:hypothetical protein
MDERDARFIQVISDLIEKLEQREVTNEEQKMEVFGDFLNINRMIDDFNKNKKMINWVCFIDQ